MSIKDAKDKWNREADEYNQWDALDEKEVYNLIVESCAASPWTYRDSNGDGTGEVVESTELPEGKIYKKCLFCFDYRSWDFTYQTVSWDGDDFWSENHLFTNDWLRKHLIAWAVIQGGK